ncbi:von Willebrand factor D and EGF domain-containing protein [Rhagoletis pomonella]|uniref:von Willebrand factor D and EGF domain-containing protein n=1 Tax=Rhagoletis pomonella TaxID=28610 RepID=UPI001783FE72|nr:von Willebrand factor D and EGF domain-containing protein [Rhagoletis pomonella]
MHFIVPIILTACLSAFGIIAAERCPQYRYVPKTRLKPKQVREDYTDKNWLGFDVIKTRYRMDYVKEYYSTTEIFWVCCPGYIERDSVCERICAPSCPANSRCSGPQRCSCNFGYSSTTSDPDKIVCKPKCPAGCPANSTCTSPFECTCDQGYEEHVDGSCQPVCTAPCPQRASCAAPETCRCAEGYKLTVDGQECVPECKNGCPLNMYCQAPDQCACRTGYVLKTNPTESAEQTTGVATDECVPVCSEGCPAHSHCMAPDVCRCEEGYTMHTPEEEEAEGTTTNNSMCVPVCAERCPLYASCMRPNQCECASGYLMIHLPQHRPYCQAQCTQNCSLNGKCVAPNVCQCFDGYEHVNSTATKAHALEPYCQPKCANGCPHGICFAPEVCVCQPGYLMGAQGICEPVCSKGCQHGRCIEPEICACDEGYRLSAHDYNKCEPICLNACINADCAAPDICLCREGYVPHENATQAHICRPECGHGCEHGICVAPGQCACEHGFELNTSGEMTKCVPISTTGMTTEAATDTTETTPDIYKTTMAKAATALIISSTAYNDAWFTKGIIAESLTTVDEKQIAEALMPKGDLEVCKDSCYCWLEETVQQMCFEIGPVDSEKCIAEQYLHCNEIDKRIIYSSPAETRSYICGYNRTTSRRFKNASNEGQLWILIGGVIIIVLMLIAIVYLCVRIYQTRHETGAHDIPISLLMKF